MNPEAQRIAIAEACGWTKIRQRAYVATQTDEPFHEPSGLVGVRYARNIEVLVPYYLTDLNAMHEAEKVLTDEQRRLYAAFLASKFNGWSMFALGKLLCATAAQRAEAFLRTIGKWVE